MFNARLVTNYKLIFGNDECIIIDQNMGKLITTVKKTPNKIFPLMTPLEQHITKCKNLDESILWHLRYGQLNFYSFKLSKQKDIYGAWASSILPF